MSSMNQLSTALMLVVMPLGTAYAIEDSCLFENNRDATTRIQYSCVLANGDGNCESSGSGFIVSESGLVITNDHVIRPAGNVTVESEEIYVKTGSLGAGSVRATVVARDKVNDIALLQLPPRDYGESWQSVAIGTAVPTPVGDSLMALGFAGRELAMIPNGMKTAELAEVDGVYRPWWQTNLALNEGNSGGPVFGSNGTVIGISVAYKRSSQLISYVIPIYYAKPFLEQAGAQAVVYSSCATYPECRNKIHGIERYAVDMTVDKLGEWQAKKSSRPEFCNAYLSKLQSQFPKSEFTYLQSSQHTAMNGRKREHIYYCKFQRLEGPIYKLARSEFCLQ
ncbi:hypothetical protein VP02_18850 [Pseudomonas ogarae]|uniref:Uncharacterized protein n=1 Tax=Pseudomonas kilonensis TaxID=132476 RepID=A0A0F4XKA7_9PSED|nr:serine protease [Pseudomonas ogarae]KKA06211.1 hypothetical protein VP02_18850 [Pseudomonas ogarae]